MLAAWVWTSTVFFSFLNLHNAAAQSQMCEEPFQAVVTLAVNVTFPTPVNFVDPDLVFYRKVLRFTEEEIDRDREAAMQFFHDNFGLDFTNIEPNELGQRILGNATFEPFMYPFNWTYVHNSWLVNGRAKTRCFPAAGGGYRVRFTGTMMLHGEYGGEEGKLATEPVRIFQQRQYVYEVCKQQGIIFQLETPTPFRTLEADPIGLIPYNWRVRHRILGEGIAWGVGRGFPINPTTLRYENRLVYTFL